MKITLTKASSRVCVYIYGVVVECATCTLNSCAHLNVGPHPPFGTEGLQRSPLALHLYKLHKFNGVQSIWMDVQCFQRCTIQMMVQRWALCEIHGGCVCGPFGWTTRWGPPTMCKTSSINFDQKLHYLYVLSTHISYNYVLYLLSIFLPALFILILIPFLLLFRFYATRFWIT